MAISAQVKTIPYPAVSCKPTVSTPVSHHRLALLCHTTPWPAHACWSSNLVSRPKNTTNSCWWYFVNRSMWTAQFGYVTRNRLCLNVCSTVRTTLMLAGFFLGRMSSLVRQPNLVEIGIRIRYAMEMWLTFEPKTYLRFTQTAPWLGYLTRLVTSFLKKPSRRECWLMAVVFTVVPPGGQVFGELAPMLKGTLQPSTQAMASMLSRSLIFWFLCKPVIGLWFLSFVTWKSQFSYYCNLFEVTFLYFSVLIVYLSWPNSPLGVPIICTITHARIHMILMWCRVVADILNCD